MTSKAKDIYDTLVSEFPNQLIEITKLSRNDAANKDFIVSPVQAFNFDHIENLGTADNKCEKSPDALFYHQDKDILYFIEFKEGGHKRDDVRQKVHEGILTLFQYAKHRRIATRSEFYELNIRFALVTRNKEEGTPGESFLAALEASEDVFNLKNMEGLLVEKTVVHWNPESIYSLLHNVSGGAVDSIEWVNKAQSTRIVIPTANSATPLTATQ
ncbi:hypothetical protein [Burkholderia sp. KJ006]|uniref:hypothetical protein n=1 Tax=Burkholderia sp. KJ006 TaxID=416344 RepID=UPI0011D22D12|nr:hypothetical protein [Burkholderia sp. KJ006]